MLPPLISEGPNGGGQVLGFPGPKSGTWGTHSLWADRAWNTRHAIHENGGFYQDFFCGKPRRRGFEMALSSTFAARLKPFPFKTSTFAEFP
jgi:hypothetical protein